MVLLFHFYEASKIGHDPCPAVILGKESERRFVGCTAAMTSLVMGVDRPSFSSQRFSKASIASGVFGQTVDNMDHGPRCLVFGKEAPIAELNLIELENIFLHVRVWPLAPRPSVAPLDVGRTLENARIGSPTVLDSTFGAPHHADASHHGVNTEGESGRGRMANTDKRKQSLYFPEEMLKEIQDEANRQDRSLSWIVQQAWRIARTEITRFPSVNDVLESGRDE